MNVRRHARPNARVNVLQQDARGEAFNIVFDGGLRRDAFDVAGNFQAGHGFDLHLDLLPDLEPGHVRLIDVRVDDHFVQVGDGQHFGAAVESAGTGDGLSDRNRSRQNGAIEWGQDFRLGQLVFDQVKRLIGAVEGVAGQLILRLRVLEEFLRDKFVGIELFGPFVVALRLLQLQFCRFDFDQFRRAIRLQVLVVEREQHAVLFDPITNVHRQREDFAVDFRPDRNLVGRADFPRRADGEMNVASFHHRGSGMRVGRRGARAREGVAPFLESPGAPGQHHSQNDPFLHALRTVQARQPK